MTMADFEIVRPTYPWYSTPKGRFPNWFWPLPIWRGNLPMWTGNEFDEDHPGVDLAYPNEFDVPSDPPQVYGGDNENKYFVPSNSIFVYAPGPGRIWFSGETEQGWTVRIDHGSFAYFPLNSYLTHMSRLLVPLHASGPDGPNIYAGQLLGIAGAGPTQANHSHLELWDFSTGPAWGRPGTPLDPKLYLPCFWRILQPE